MEKDHQNKNLLSAEEILRRHHKWIRKFEFDRLVAEKKGITERQARNIITKEYKENKILRNIFSDGATIYGLAEFGPPVSEVNSNDCKDTNPKETFQRKDDETKIQNSNIAENYYCEKCGILLVQRSATYGRHAPTDLSHEHACPSCGFKNDLLKAHAEKYNLVMQDEQALKPKISEDEIKRALQAIELARHELRFFREPTLNQIAVKVGGSPEAVRLILNELIRAHLIDWKEQSEKQAQKEARDAIDLASWLSWKKKGEANGRLNGLFTSTLKDASEEVLERAQNILKNYPDLAPKVNHIEPNWRQVAPKRPNGKGLVCSIYDDAFVMPPEIAQKLQSKPVPLLEWPEETKEKWREIFVCLPPMPIYFGP